MIGKLEFLVFSDIHDNWDFLEMLREKYSKYDFVVFLGDVSNRYDVELAKELVPYVDYYIPGNMDNREIEEVFSHKSIHEKVLRYGDYNIVGLGYSNPTPFNTPGELSEEDIYEKLSSLPISNNTILFTHAPPKGILDETSSGLSVGSVSIRRIVDEKKPLLHMFGHIHEAIGVAKDGTVFANLPPAYEGGYTVVEIEDGKPIVNFLKVE